MIRSARLALLLLLALPRPLLAQVAAPVEAAEPPRLRLPDLAAQLRTHHPLLAAGRARLRGARAAAVAAGVWSNPILDASYTAALRRSSYDPIGAPVVGVTQFLELAGAPRARRRAAELEADATSSDAAALERALLAELALAYYAHAGAVERVKTHEAYARELERVERLVKARVEGGMSPRYDATRVALALVEARAATAAAQADRHRTHGDLTVAAGVDVGPEAADTDVDFEAPVEIPPLAVTQRALDTSPLLSAARRRTEAAAAAVTAARKSVWPGLGVRLGGGFGQAPGQLDLSLGVVVPLPLLDRGQGAIPASEARVDEARAESTALDRSTRQQLVAAHAELTRRAAALDAFRQESRALLGPLREQAEAGYKDGRLSAFELIEAYQSARDARLRQIELAAAALSARASLRRTAGSGDR